MARDRPLARRFLVPVDQSEECTEAVDLATYLARAVGGSVTLLGLVPVAVPPSAVDGAGAVAVTLTEPEEQDAIDRRAREQVQAMAARIGDALPVRTAMSWSPAAQAILDEIESGEHDIVVVFTRREGALGHLIHDHAIRQLLGRSPVPVLVVPAGPDGS